MPMSDLPAELMMKYLAEGNHAESDYFGLIREILVQKKEKQAGDWDEILEEIYALVLDEIKNNQKKPTETVNFGTSGWRGILGKDINIKSVKHVTAAIIKMYESLATNSSLCEHLGVKSLDEAKEKGCVIGFDNRFGGELLAVQAGKSLVEAGFAVHYAGESTTGVLSAAVLIKQCAFSINLTPSHNPLDYGGYKFNAADAGPAAKEVTEIITQNARDGIASDQISVGEIWTLDDLLSQPLVTLFDSLECWKDLLKRNEAKHGLNLENSITDYLSKEELVMVIDSVHGASRLHMDKLFGTTDRDNLILLRNEPDVTFGGVAPEPSSANMQMVIESLGKRPEPLKIGAIIDPDGDRIRFTDGTTEISMNQFGAMAYHFLHEIKGVKGKVAKTVATSNLANSLAEQLAEEIFEPSVGFKNFKPVIGEAVVLFEESDGISIVGHTPEKDAYIGLLLALEMVLRTGMNLGDYLEKIENEFGHYYPDRDGVVVSIKGQELLDRLHKLKKYEVGTTVQVGENALKIEEVLTIDGRKMIFEDGSWLMIRPSGTEPKVRFYVESRTEEGTVDLVEAAKQMLQEINLL